MPNAKASLMHRCATTYRSIFKQLLPNGSQIYFKFFALKLRTLPFAKRGDRGPRPRKRGTSECLGESVAHIFREPAFMGSAKCGHRDFAGFSERKIIAASAADDLGLHL